MTLVLLVHAAATLAMTGLIWFVQLVHYPLFGFASGARFADFASAYQRRTTWVVLPLMSAELGTAIWILIGAPTGLRPLAIWGAALLAVIWVSTALVQVPLHRRLAAGFDDRLGRRLVRSNWLRTVAWSARSVIALALLGP